MKNRLILFAIISSIAILSIIFFIKTNNERKDMLRNELIAIATLGSSFIDGDTIEKIKEKDDLYSEEYQIISDQLNKIKKSDPSVKFVYTMRKTDDPYIVEFIVDADNPLTIENPDINSNGIIDKSEELSLPGNKYNAKNTPELLRGFIEPSADQDINADQWGSFLSAYAPIKNSKNETVAILGVDMSAISVEKALNRTQKAFGFIMILTLAIASNLYSLLVSKQKELKLLEETNTLKSSFLAKISHELRTPIIAISGFVDLILETNKKLTPDTKSHLQSINIYASRLARKINNILDFAKIKASKTSISKTDFYIKDLVEEILNSLKPIIKENKLDISLDIKNTKDTVYTDKEKCHDILINLIINAIKFTPSKGEIKISSKEKDNMLILEVSDSGIGIPKMHLENIFSDFTQLDTSESLRKYKGSGLGLYIVNGLVQLLGGEIEVKSDVGIGSVFTIKIPL